MSDPKETLAAGRLIARMKAPYFRTVLVGLAPVEVKGLGTIGVTKNGVLLVDYDFLAKVTPAQCAGLMVHEVMHIVLKHCDRRGSRDPKLDNMAGDLAINPAIVDMGLELPDGELAGLFPEKFGFPRGLTKDEYYELLLKEVQKQPQPGQSGAKGKAGQRGDEPGGKGGKGEPDEPNDEQGEGGSGGDDDHDHDGKGAGGQGGESQDGDDKPHTGGGWCGSCAGRAMPNEPEEDNEANRSEAEVERMVRAVAEAVREHAAKGIGKVPAGLARWAEKALEPARIPWQTKLALITRNAVAWRDGAVDHRYDAPGRRQAGIGYGPGKPIMPRLRQPVPRVAIAVDTSGSMGTNELRDACREAAGVLKAVGADVEFLACDCRVHTLQPVRRWEDIPALLKGGGGTDFNPIFEALDKRRPRPEVVVVMTDGMGPAPAQAPRGMKVVWVGIGPFKQRPAVWGEWLEVDEPPKGKKGEAA